MIYFWIFYSVNISICPHTDTILTDYKSCAICSYIKNPTYIHCSFASVSVLSRSVMSKSL